MLGAGRTVHVLVLQVVSAEGGGQVLVAAAALRGDVPLLAVRQRALGGQVAGDVRRQVGLVWSREGGGRVW